MKTRNRVGFRVEALLQNHYVGVFNFQKIHLVGIEIKN